MLIRRPKDGCYKARKSGATAEVGPAPRRWRAIVNQLGRIEDMPSPYFGQTILADKVDAVLPPRQQRYKLLEALQLLGRDARVLAKFIGAISSLLRVAFHVKRQR